MSGKKLQTAGHPIRRTNIVLHRCPLLIPFVSIPSISTCMCGKRMVFYAYTCERQLKIVYHPVTTGRDWFRKGNSTDLLFGNSIF